MTLQMPRSATLTVAMMTFAISLGIASCRTHIPSSLRCKPWPEAAIRQFEQMRDSSEFCGQHEALIASILNDAAVCSALKALR